jgi:hypothetical protein
MNDKILIFRCDLFYGAKSDEVRRKFRCFHRAFLSSLSSLSILFGEDIELLCQPFFVDIVMLWAISVVVAQSTLRAITFVSARYASLQLTSIAPTPLDVHILGRRNGRLRSSPLAALRSNSHPSPLLRLTTHSYSRALRCIVDFTTDAIAAKATNAIAAQATDAIAARAGATPRANQHTTNNNGTNGP